MFMLCAAAAAASLLSTVLTNYERCRSHRSHQRKHADNHRSTAVELGEAFQLRGSMHLSSYDRLFPSQEVHTGRGMGNLIAAPLNGKRRQHGTTLFLNPATLEPFDDQWAYLSSIARLSARDVAALARSLPHPKVGHDVRGLQLPTSSKVVPRPSAIIRARLAARITVTAADLGVARHGDGTGLSRV
jgi:hypothetical protein